MSRWDCRESRQREEALEKAIEEVAFVVLFWFLFVYAPLFWLNCFSLPSRSLFHILSVS